MSSVSVREQAAARVRFRRVSIPGELGLKGQEAKECKKILLHNLGTCLVSHIKIQEAEECNLIVIDDELFALKTSVPTPAEEGVEVIQNIEDLKPHVLEMMQSQTVTGKKKKAKNRRPKKQAKDEKNDTIRRPIQR